VVVYADVLNILCDFHKDPFILLFKFFFFSDIILYKFILS
jgi:hypothetical protein